VVANASIIKKVSFPREIPALASVGSQIVQQLGFQSVVMVVFLLVFRRGPAMEYLPLLIPALLALVLLAAAFGVIFAAINVRMRDMQYLLGVALQIWVWACPIMYQYHLVQQKVLDHPAIKPIFVLWRLNPILPIVLTFQRTLYSVTSPLGAGGARIHILPDHAGPLWYLWQLGAVIAFAIALLVVAFKLFDRLEGNFAEEL
jgi:ABC-2 type transport system permease protein